jgi:NAD(P)-dependent dehydrogenase (short-subunit alcohol dehydrogenase family)
MTTQRTIVVTGGSRGIGAAICRKLAASGYPVALNYMSNAAAAAAVVKDIGDAGGRAMAFVGDVANEDDVRRLFDDAERTLGPLGGLVNNAGIIGGNSRVDQVSLETLHRTFATNVFGAFLCAREAVRRLSTRHGGTGGAIVNLSSVAVRLGSPGEFVHYAASKGAIDSFTLGLAREVAAEGIRVNAVAPGLTETDQNPPERLARLVPSVPIRRVAQAEEIAEAVAWLLSPAASYVVGTILTASGGR